MLCTPPTHSWAGNRLCVQLCMIYYHKIRRLNYKVKHVIDRKYWRTLFNNQNAAGLLYNVKYTQAEG